MLHQELVQELENIQNIAEQKTTHWEDRVNAINQLVCLCEKYEEKKEFAEELKIVESSFAVQLKDLRSKVITSVCDVIQNLAKILQIEIENFIVNIYPHLRKQLSNKKEIFFGTVNSTIQTILNCCAQSTKIFRLVVETTKDKSSSTRALAFLDIEQFLTNNYETFEIVINEVKNELFDALKSGLLDSSPDVRGKSSSLYWVLHPKFPEECEEVYSKLPSSKQDRILQAKKEKEKENENKLTNDKEEQNIKLAPKKEITKIELPIRKQRIKVQIEKKKQQQKQQKQMQFDTIIAKPLKPWITTKIKKLWNNDSWKEREEILIELANLCDKYAGTMEVNDWKEVSALLSVFLFSEGHYRVLEQAMKTFQILLRVCSINNISILLENHKTFCLEQKKFKEMEEFGVSFAKNYGILGSLCYISRCGGTQEIRSDCKNILSFLLTSIPSHKLFEFCYQIFENIHQQNENIKEDVAYLLTGCCDFMCEFIIGNSYFDKNNEAYVEIVDILLAILQLTKNIGTKNSIENLIRKIYLNDTIEFSLQTQELDTIVIQNIIQPEKLFTVHECKIFISYISDSKSLDYFSSCDKDLNSNEILNISKIINNLKNLEIQMDSIDQINYPILEKTIFSLITLCKNDRGSDWFVNFPILFELFQILLEKINKSSSFNLCKSIPLCLLLLIGFYQLVFLLPNTLTLQVVNRKIVQNTENTLTELCYRKFISNCSSIACDFLSILQNMKGKKFI